MKVLAVCLTITAAVPAGARCLMAGEGPSEPSNAAPASDVTLRGPGEKPVLVYRTVASPQKPYVRELYSPAGVQVLRDSPADHKHHHGLMFAVTVDGVDFWGEESGSGRQLGGNVEGSEAREQNGVKISTIRQQLDWLSKEDRPLAVERRTIETYSAKDLPCTLVTWESQLAAADGHDAIELTGHHYFGLGLRFVESMDQGGRFFNSEKAEGESVRGSERLTTAKWCAYTASADGKPVTVAIFDCPKNLRPARMFTMAPPFAYLSATINLWKEPLTVKAGQPLSLRYGVAVWDGEATPEQVEAAYQRWLRLEG